jgi:hypothetical protein
LGDRIAIMAKGRLKCVGTALHLKNKFGLGYRLNIVSNTGRGDAVSQQLMLNYGKNSIHL